jgi:hypothetical protein
MINKLPFAFLGCLAIVGCNRQEVPVTPVRDAAELKILDYAGLERLIASHRGQVVVMDAWSTACPPCVRDFPRLVALDRKFSAQGLACISLSFDYDGSGSPQEQLPSVLEFLRRQGATFDNVLSSEKPDAMYTKLNFPSVPAVFVYDRQGMLVERMQESIEGSGEKPLYDRVEILVAKLLERPR